MKKPDLLDTTLPEFAPESVTGILAGETKEANLPPAWEAVGLPKKLAFTEDALSKSGICAFGFAWGIGRGRR